MATIDIRDLLDTVEPNAAAVAAAVVGGLALLIILRRVGVRRLAVTAAVSIGLGASVESAWTFAGRALDLSGGWRAVPAVLFESAALATAARAVEYHRRHGTPGPYVRWVWGFAVVAGIAPALSARTLSEAVFRLLIPLVAAAVWYGDYATAKRHEGTVTWRLSPRRIGIRLGLIEAGEKDIEHVHHEHRVRALTTAAHRYHHGARVLRRWHGARLRRLALTASETMVGEAAARLDRVHRIAELTAPDQPLPAVATTGPAPALPRDPAAVSSVAAPALPAEPTGEYPQLGGGTGRNSGRKRARSKEHTRRRVHALADGGLKPPEVAETLDISERYVRELLGTTTGTTPARINGHDHAKPVRALA